MENNDTRKELNGTGEVGDRSGPLHKVQRPVYDRRSISVRSGKGFPIKKTERKKEREFGGIMKETWEKNPRM